MTLPVNKILIWYLIDGNWYFDVWSWDSWVPNSRISFLDRKLYRRLLLYICVFAQSTIEATSFASLQIDQKVRTLQSWSSWLKVFAKVQVNICLNFCWYLFFWCRWNNSAIFTYVVRYSWSNIFLWKVYSFHNY